MVENVNSGCCSSFFSALPHPFSFFRFSTLWENNNRYSNDQLTDLENRRNVEVVDKYFKATPKQLSETISASVKNIFNWFCSKQTGVLKKHIDVSLDYFNRNNETRDQLFTFISDTAASTLVNLLYSETSNRADELLLEAIMAFALPNVIPPQPQPGPEPSLYQRVFNRGQRVMEALFSVTECRPQHLNNVPEYLRALIETTSKEKNVDPQALACYTKYFNLESLKNVFKNRDDCQSYLSKVLALYLKNRVNEGLRDPELNDKIFQVLERLQPLDNKQSEINLLVDKLSPLLIQRVIDIFTNLLSVKYSFTDKGVEILNKHLQGLSVAKQRADDYRADELNGGDPISYTPAKLRRVLEKINESDPLTSGEEVIALTVWGDRYRMMDRETRGEALTEFMDRYQGEYDTFAFFRMGNEADVSLKDLKSGSLEFSELIYKLTDSFLNDAFLTQLVQAAREVPSIKKILPEERDVKNLEQLFPFFKFVLRIYLIQTIHGDNAESGAFKEFENTFSKKSVESHLETIALPALKETLYEMFIHQIIRQNISLLNQPNEIYKAIRAAYPDVAKDRLLILQMIGATLQQYTQFVENLEPSLRPGDDPKKIVQCFEKYSGMPEKVGENLAGYSRVVKLLLFDFGGLPGWLKWIFGFFDSAISRFATALLYNYRKTPAFFSKIFQRQLETHFGTPERVQKVMDPDQDDPQPTTRTKVEDISKLFYSYMTYNSSFFHRTILWLTLGSEGSRITSVFNHAIANTLYVGTDINVSFIMRLVRTLNDKVEDASFEATGSEQTGLQGPFVTSHGVEDL